MCSTKCHLLETLRIPETLTHVTISASAWPVSDFWGTPNFRLISNSNCLEVTGMCKHVNASFRSVFGTFRKVMMGLIDRLLVRRMASIDFSCLVVNKSSRGAQFPPQSFLFSEKLLHLVVEV